MALPRFGAEDDPLTYSIIGCAIRVHKKLGPGLNESVYNECMVTSLQSAGLSFRRHAAVRIPYEGKILDKVFRPDFVIEDEVLLELKSINAILPVHDAQVLSYMRLAAIQRGLLINFNVALLKDGIRRFILTKAPGGRLRR